MNSTLKGTYTALARLLVLGLLFAAAGGNIACAQQPAEQGAAPAPLKTEDIAAYIRKVFNVPPNVTINVKEEAQSAIPGLRALKVEVTSDRGSQTQDAWVTMDGKTLVWGKSYDMSVDPFQQNLAKMKLEGAPVTGNKDAKVTVVEYTDFQCPYCSRAHTTVEQLLKDYDGKIKVVYKSLPLNIHNWAEDAAVAGSCVAEQNNDAFWTFAHYFFENQKTLTKETLMEKVYELAAQNKLDDAKLKACITGRTTLPRVQADMKEAQALGFNSTPSFVVNGRPVVGAVPIEQFRQVIDEALASAK
jgi:protein-disulfide isomerase